jgi:hypothetical protein
MQEREGRREGEGEREREREREQKKREGRGRERREGRVWEPVCMYVCMYHTYIYIHITS